MVIGERLTYTDPPTPVLALKGLLAPPWHTPCTFAPESNQILAISSPASLSLSLSLRDLPPTLRWETMSIWMHDSITDDDISARGYYGIRISRENLKEQPVKLGHAEDTARLPQFNYPADCKTLLALRASFCHLNQGFSNQGSILPVWGRWNFCKTEKLIYEYLALSC